jgi:hypothetical protein
MITLTAQYMTYIQHPESDASYILFHTIYKSQVWKFHKTSPTVKYFGIINADTHSFYTARQFFSSHNQLPLYSAYSGMGDFNDILKITQKLIKSELISFLSHTDYHVSLFWVWVFHYFFI